MGERTQGEPELVMLDLLVVKNLLVLDSSVDRRTDRIKRNLGNQSVGD